MQKFLFLDIDGVLNSEKIFIANHEQFDYVDLLNIRGEPFSRSSLNTLRKIVLEYNFKIVLSSAWRMWYYNGTENDHTYALNKALEFYNMSFCEFTPFNNREMARGIEIEGYLEAHNISKKDIIILDDETFDMGNMVDRVVKTNWNDGLQPEDFEKVKKLMNLEKKNV